MSYKEKTVLFTIAVIMMGVLLYLKDQNEKRDAALKAQIEKAIKEDAAVRWCHVVDSVTFSGDLCVQCPYCGKIINSDSFK